MERWNLGRGLEPSSKANLVIGVEIMLVLSRKKNESIVINGDITIVVVEIRGDKVKLGVEAPREVTVHRREVYDAIQRSQRVDNLHGDSGSTLSGGA